MGTEQEVQTRRKSSVDYRCPFCLQRFPTPEQVARHLVYSKCGQRASRNNGKNHDNGH